MSVTSHQLEIVPRKKCQRTGYQREVIRIVNQNSHSCDSIVSVVNVSIVLKKQDQRHTALDHFINIQTKKGVRLLIHCSGLLVLVAIQKSSTNETLILTSALILLQKVEPTTHSSQLVYRYSYIKLDLRCTGLDQCIDSPTKRKTYDTLVLATVSIVLRKVGLTIHWSRPMYRLSYKKQDLRYTDLDYCIDSPTQSRTYDTLVSTSVSIVLLLSRTNGLQE